MLYHVYFPAAPVPCSREETANHCIKHLHCPYCCTSDCYGCIGKLYSLSSMYFYTLPSCGLLLLMHADFCICLKDNFFCLQWVKIGVNIANFECCVSTIVFHTGLAGELLICSHQTINMFANQGSTQWCNIVANPNLIISMIFHSY